MKFLIVFVLSVVITNAIPSSRVNVRNCIFNANPEPTEEIKRKNDEICYTSCLDRKIGWMKQDGSYDEDRVLSKAKTSEERLEYKSKLDDAKEKCQVTEKHRFLCEYALCVNKQAPEADTHVNNQINNMILSQSIDLY